MRWKKFYETGNHRLIPHEAGFGWKLEGKTPQQLIDCMLRGIDKWQKKHGEFPDIFVSRDMAEDLLFILRGQTQLAIVVDKAIPQNARTIFFRHKEKEE